ncbi:hypothetical protein LTS18_013383 [Coniosporium uncinatum]|uniref:Uncharacterized protein n=1 Tax=Coniosporium uncinatum TaxID=93489 RepID=A0ACC3CWZ8_9PEZI|nr:hypothetical protein LTS18_013383 [Coniosporium uncinatum]
MAWIDKRKTEVCEFHVSLQVEKAKRGRMEVNTMVGHKGGQRGGGGQKWRGGGRGGEFRDDGLVREGRYHEKFLHETMYIAPTGMGTTNYSVLDDAGALDRQSKKEALKKRKVEREKEAELGKQLASIGQGIGAEYARIRHKVSVDTGKGQAAPDGWTAPEPPDAGKLGLLGNRARDVHLSPMNKKRGHGTMSSEPVGWGGAYKRGLPSSPKMSKKVEEDPEGSPSKKRARFLLDKGIREPGRESLGNLAAPDDDDDDDLDIV